MMRRVTGGRWPEIRAGEQLSCPEVGRLLQQFLDGELDRDSEISSLADHLEECKRCGLEADTYRKIKQALASRRAEVPPESVERLRQFGERLADS
ncbi:MAG: zf-HC2 domain-containing protein [Ilumatobacter sp.]|uniref:anti-sigma factor family protein n=1 Tax=Ilumatobacter sp. TaxID=1967498 RepID=UPI0026222CFF|nr:zf-HC2 domain-containing protein [Ilumatobacter sp.]MDJ0768792.1 zf-HC2 domain-containing protein [Ilumatobacter sp.]